jgi:hypothetical protein
MSVAVVLSAMGRASDGVGYLTECPMFDISKDLDTRLFAANVHSKGIKYIPLTSCEEM